MKAVVNVIYFISTIVILYGLAGFIFPPEKSGWGALLDSMAAKRQKEQAVFVIGAGCVGLACAFIISKSSKQEK